MDMAIMIGVLLERDLFPDVMPCTPALIEQSMHQEAHESSLRFTLRERLTFKKAHH